MTSLHIGLAGLRRPALYRGWLRAGVQVTGWDADAARVEAAARDGVRVLASIVAVAQTLPAPRVIWVDVAPGRATELALQDTWPELARGEMIVDGGDSDFRDAPRRAASLAAAGVLFADVGVHLEGVDRHGDIVDRVGALTVGGTPAAAASLMPLLDAVGPWLHCGTAGAGHFVRMVRTGLDTVTRAAHAEARDLLRAHPDLVHDAAAVVALLPTAPRGAGHDRARALGDGIVDAAMAAGVAAPVLSLALLLAQADTVSAARAREEDASS